MSLLVAHAWASMAKLELTLRSTSSRELFNNQNKIKNCFDEKQKLGLVKNHIYNFLSL